MKKEEFVERAKEIHAGKYDYSLIADGNLTYKQKVPIVCPKHGTFTQGVGNHLNGQNCPICGKIKRNHIYGKDEFIQKAREIHGDKYDYSKVDFIDTKTKVCIIYPGHGEFWQSPSAHLSGHGWKHNPKEGRDEFIQKAREIHGDKYDYSKVDYNGTENKVCIICPEHGEFWQSPYNHLLGRGCPTCGGTKKYTTDEFIQKARETHGDKYDYSKTEYINNSTKVCIICPVHGEFWQRPSKHLSGEGCYYCGRKISAEKQKMTCDEFIQKAREIHGDKYDYSKVKYNSYEEYITIGCPIHGYFKQSPDSHLHSGGCPKCGSTLSKNEDEIYNFICSIIGNENVIQRYRKLISPQEIDIFIPSLNIGFEYHGLYWHSERNVRMTKTYHYNKMLRCNEQGVKLYQIFEDEYVHHKEIVLSKIRHIIGLGQNLPHIMGRKITVKKISGKEAEVFLSKNHIQGYVKSTVHIGGFFNEELISVMSFTKSHKNLNIWELTRFATEINHLCQGVGGKMFSYFIRTYNPDEIKSFADRRWTQDEENLYTIIGFKKDGYIKPDYRYYNENINPYERIHKFNFRKQILNKKYGLPIEMTEKNMADTLGYVKIWDCGLVKYIWKKEK